MREMRGGLMAIYMLVIRGSGGTETDVLSADGTRRNSMKLWQGRFSLDITKRFFIQKVFGHWNRLRREVATAPAWQCSRGIWRMFTVTFFGWFFAGSVVRLDDPCGLLPTQDIL